MTKFQTPNNNQYPITKFQTRYLVIGKLVIGIYLVIGAWFLVISPMAFASEERFFEIKAKQFVYTPNIIKVNKGDRVMIRLISKDVTHGLFIDGYAQNTSAHPGEDGNISFLADKTGRFTFRCSVTCGEFHPYMVGYLIVEPNSRFIAYILLVIFIGLTSLLLILRKKKEVTANE